MDHRTSTPSLLVLVLVKADSQPYSQVWFLVQTKLHQPETLCVFPKFIYEHILICTGGAVEVEPQKGSVC